MSKTVFYDLETAGLKVSDAIIQIAAVAVDDESFEELSVFEAKIKFDAAKADPAALKVNGYTEARWIGAESELPVLNNFGRFLSQHATVQLMSKNQRPYKVARLGGHNICGFDNDRIMAAFRRNDLFFPGAFGGCLDTLHGAAWFFQQQKDVPKPSALKLSVLAAHFGIDFSGEGAHEALADVRMSIALAKRFCS